MFDVPELLFAPLRKKFAYGKLLLPLYVFIKVHKFPA